MKWWKLLSKPSKKGSLGKMRRLTDRRNSVDCFGGDAIHEFLSWMWQ